MAMMHQRKGAHLRYLLFYTSPDGGSWWCGLQKRKVGGEWESARIASVDKLIAPHLAGDSVEDTA